MLFAMLAEIDIEILEKMKMRKVYRIDGQTTGDQESSLVHSAQVS